MDKIVLTTKLSIEDLILDESYETTMLLGYGLKHNPTDKQVEEYIKDRIDKFF